MKVDSRDSGGDTGAKNPRPGTEGIRVCPICNTPLAADDAGEYCAVCMLRRAIGGAGDSGEASGSFDSGAERGFGHYELVLNEDGSAVELGRGAMGVTYKAFDTELRCPVALKEIGERYLGDEDALRRFLREARAAASLRHPNVASVFHLGRTGRSYFYAMEFVEGETLERLIKRSGRLDVMLALDIASQVTAGLAAIHRKQLIHRDIKPANIMISFEERDAARVKIIDLGLAKSLGDSRLESAISAPGAFAGTPEFASPEQFVGSSVDIRSDLYSLGVTLWDMVTGQVPFRGTPVEVMYQHRDRSPPAEQIKSLPQPVVVLLEVLLEKNPDRRFQAPAELQDALEAVKGAVLSGRRMLKTIRVNVVASGDVQKERNLADRLMRSIAAESNLPVSVAEINFQRLVEADLALQPSAPDESGGEPGNLVMCLSFSEDETTGDRTVGDHVPRATNFDLAICIVWARLDPLVGSILTVPDHPVNDTGIDSEIALTQGDVGSGPAAPRLIVYRNGNNPILPLEPKEARDEFGRRWDAVQEFFAGWERTKAGRVSANVTNYQSLQEFEEVFRKDFRRFIASRLTENGEQEVSRPKARRWQSSPFRGLNLFGFEHSPIFHGRTKSIGEVLDAIEAQVRVGRPFVIVVGPSGSGKSSLVQAGVLPLLTQPGTIEGIRLWRRAVTRPGAGGSGGDCFDALAAALLEPTSLPALQDPESTNGTQDLARELREHADSVAIRVRDALDSAGREWKLEHRYRLEQQASQLRASGRQEDSELVRKRAERIELPKTRLALVIDQLEELFTTGFSLQIRQKYVSAIADLARSGRVYVLATLRSDFYSWYQQFPELIELTKPSGKVDLRPPGSHEIGEIIRLPAEAAGLSFEQESGTGHRLDEALRDVASATPESLPLLEHVLSLLYDEQVTRGDHILRWSDYRDLGELKGALALHAERVFATLQQEEQDAFARVMRYLVTLGQGEEEVPNRRTVPYLDFVPLDKSDDSAKLGAKGFIDRFIQARLLVADTDPHGETTVSVAHEALLREWRRVREWLTENREFLRMRDRLDASLKLWLSRGRQKDDLLRPGLALAEGEKLAADFGSSLNEQQTGYIHASISERTRLRAAQERARYRVMGGVTAALIVAVIFGILSFRQYRRAERAKVAADRAARTATLARNQAENLINFMTIDLRDKLRPIGRLDLLDAVSRRVQAYYNAFVVSDDDPEILRQRSIALVNSADIRKDLGDLIGALNSYGEALATQRKLASQDSKNAKWQQDICSSLEKIGDVLVAQGKVPLAREKFQEALDIRERLVEALQLDLSLSYVDVGYILSVQGDSDRALEYCNRALAIRETLLRQQPGDADLKRYKSTCLDQIGHELAVLGDLEKALEVFRQSLDITRELAAGDSNAIWQRDYSISLERVGDVLAAQGKWTDALGNYQAAHSIRLKLLSQDPKNSMWQSDLFWTYQDIGDVKMAQNKAEEALHNYNESFAIAKRLTETDSTNGEWQSNLAVISEKRGEALAMQGRLAEALQNYHESFVIAKRLTETDPSNNEWQSSLAIVSEKNGEALAVQGNLPEALEEFRNSLAICEKLVRQNPKNVQWGASEALACSGVGMTLSHMGSERSSETRAMLTRAQDIFLKLQQRSTLDARSVNRLKEIQSVLASL
jgi:serine/threonine protein kinase/tetratricopeptide (TPR) repeat protein